MNLTYIHALYDGLKQAIVRGDMLAGNSAGRLTRLALGTAGTFPRSDGMDLLTSVLILPNAATANRIVYASGSNIYGESANLAFDGTDFLLGSGIRARMVGQNRIRYLNSMARCVVDGSQTGLSINVWTTINWQTEQFDTDGIHESVTHPSRFTAQIAGKYLVIGTLYHDIFVAPVTITTVVSTKFIKNGDTSISYGASDANAANGASNIASVTNAVAILALAAGDYVEMQGYVGGSTGTWDVTALQDITQMEFAYLGE